MEVSPKIIDIKEAIIGKYSFSKFFKSSNILVKLCTTVSNKRGEGSEHFNLPIFFLRLGGHVLI